jgi:hypothetical protein
MKEHGGQICLPGGAAHGNELPEQAALRELEEELGVPSDEVTLLGRLSPSYLFVSDYIVTPVVGLRHRGSGFVPDRNEVVEMIPFALDELTDPRNHRRVRVFNGQVVSDEVAAKVPRSVGVWTTAPAICWREHKIWGATAVILGEFIEALNLARGSALRNSEE